jgi:multiple sugar transport system permease protein
MVNPSFIPRAWQFDNYVKAWRSGPFGTYLKNSVFITLTCLVGTLVSNSLVAYGFAKIRFKGRDVIFLGVLGTMMIPGMVTMIPTYVMFSGFGWIGTYLPLIVPAFGASAYYIFLLRQFFLTIPMAYNEAAKIEGASELNIFARIVLPMSKPIITTIAVFEFNAKWNDYFNPMLYLDNESMYTLQLGLRSFRGTAGVEWQKFMAASLLVLLPTVVVYACLQKYIIQGVAAGGIKGCKCFT